MLSRSLTVWVSMCRVKVLRWVRFATYCFPFPNNVLAGEFLFQTMATCMRASYLCASMDDLPISEIVSKLGCPGLDQIFPTVFWGARHRYTLNFLVFLLLHPAWQMLYGSTHVRHICLQNGLHVSKTQLFNLGFVKERNSKLLCSSCSAELQDDTCFPNHALTMPLVDTDGSQSYQFPMVHFVVIWNTTLILIIGFVTVLDFFQCENQWKSFAARLKFAGGSF